MARPPVPVPAPTTRWRPGRSRAVRRVASTAETTAVAKASNAGTARPVRCRNTAGCFRTDVRWAIMVGPV